MTLARWRGGVLDWALAVAIATGALLQQRGCDCRQDPLWLNVWVILLGTLPLGLRRRQPVMVFTVVGLGSLAHVLLGFANQFLNTFAVLVALFSVADYAPWPLPVLAGAAVALALPVNFAVDWANHGRVNLSDIPYNYALFERPGCLVTTCASAASVRVSSCSELSVCWPSRTSARSVPWPMSEPILRATCTTWPPTRSA